MKVLTPLVIILLVATIACGAGPNDILGIWKTEGDESKVEIYRCGEKICGTIIWLKNPLYSDSRDGAVGTPVIDRYNSESTFRKRLVLGLRIMEGFTEQSVTTWGNGTLYDPKSGNTYRGKIHLTAPDRLELRGYIGIPLFGRSSVWTR